MNSDYARLQRDGWQRVAAMYEDAWSGLTRLYIPDLLDAAGIAAGQRVLDEACGPGYVAEAVRDRGATPIGVDIAPGMIRIARERNPDIEFHVGDAVALDFESATFDTVVSNFGIMHAPDYAAAFAEARRVLRASGTLAFTAWGTPDESPGTRLMDGAVRAHADMAVPIPKGPDSLVLANRESCRTLLEAAGFDAESFAVRTRTRGWRVPRASFIFERERDAGVRTAALLGQQTPDTLAAIQHDVESRMQAFAEPGGGFAVPYTAHIVTIRARG